ncbi:glycosyltransferase family 4 protein [Dinghuibacter silviterrae]|uniref:Glycosyltransferase involved in cell wall biosynthesis n=1 Tax=Dinghuibacter silviterrae TaxID=1539049 RepID=A0A4R8DHA4_9BACT|nr:glycosyltransferase family 1 protein [Dinghuibacter silviterrae]TDW96614.1 glycosyltransferase involved in cell wall biosynthesis [Dinghuibacter silviterrae]
MNGARPVTIFVDAHSLDKGYQGTHSFLRELYAELLDRYPGLDIYFGTYDPDCIRRVFPELPDTHILPYKKTYPGFVRFLYDIPRYLRKYRFDYAHFQYIGVPWRTATRSIVTLHDVLYLDYPGDYPLLYRWIRKILFRDSLRRADVMTTVSDYSKGRIARHYRVREKDIHIIPNAVDVGLARVFSSRAEAEARVRREFGLDNFILCVSRVEPRKNHLLLLDAYRASGLQRQGIALVLIGAASIKVPGLQERLDRQGVLWLEAVTPEDLAAFYKACRLFVYPSRAEGFGIPPLEAALCGAPVLCSRSTAMEDFRFFDPYTFDPRCTSELTDKLLDMIHTPPGTEYLRRVSNEVSRLYSRAESARAFYTIIQQNRLAWN